MTGSKLVPRPACMQIDKDCGPRSYVTSTLEWSDTLYTTRTNYFLNDFFPKHRSQIFGDDEEITFVGLGKTRKRAELLNILRADSEIASWLDRQTTIVIGTFKGETDTIKGVFYYIIHKMAMYSVRRSRALLRNSDRISPSTAVASENGEADDEEVREIADGESVSETTIVQNSRPCSVKQSYINMNHKDASHGPESATTDSEIGIRIFPETARSKRHRTTQDTIPRDSKGKRVSKAVVDFTSLKSEYDHNDSRAASNETTGQPRSSTPLEEIGPISQTRPEIKELSTTRNWRDKEIHVTYPNDKVFPLILRAQPSLKRINPIHNDDISHQMFMARLVKYRNSEAAMNRLQGDSNSLNDMDESMILFIDGEYRNQYNMLDEDEFYEALIMQERDPAFHTSVTMKVQVLLA